PAAHPVSGRGEDPLPACRDRCRDQYRPDCRVARRAPAGQDTHLTLCGTGTCTRRALGNPLCLNRAPPPRPDAFASCRQYIFFYTRSSITVMPKVEKHVWQVL